MSARDRWLSRERLQGAGLDAALPYLACPEHPRHPYRARLSAVGRHSCQHPILPLWVGAARCRLGELRKALGRSAIPQLAVGDVALRHCLVAIETVLGLALALFCLHEFRGIKLLRTVLIVPMVITPVVVAIVCLIYASDAGMLTAFSEALGGSIRSSASRPAPSSVSSRSMSGNGPADVPHHAGRAQSSPSSPSRRRASTAPDRGGCSSIIPCRCSGR